MRNFRFQGFSTILAACFLSSVLQISSKAQSWNPLLPDPAPQPVGAARDKLKLRIPTEPKSYPSDPIESDFDIPLLKEKLGKDYDQVNTAINKEELLMKKNNYSSSHGDRQQDFVRKMLVQSMPQEIKNLNFKMPGMKRYLGSKASKKLQLWLWQVSHCPVLPKWKDLGVRYWPRHINVGRCSKKATCSFPSGMRCRISSTKDVGVLRWHCLDRFAQRKETTCMWLPFHHPVISECKCKCLQWRV